MPAKRPILAQPLKSYQSKKKRADVAGFHGEYYGLTDKNPFDESMHAIARIQELFGGKDVKIQVAPKINPADLDAPEK